MVLAFVMSMQARRRRKRGARRNVEDLDHDNHLEAVISLIFAESVETIHASWFEMPWRDGRNAMRIPLEGLGFSGVMFSGESDQLLRDIEWALDHRHPALYESASKLLTMAHHEMARPWLHAYARIIQLYSSHSHGGGYAYNALLNALIEHVPIDGENRFADSVKLARCFDAIGTSYQMANDNGDRVRRAFLTLWEGNHHRAIYALPTIR